MSLDPQVIKTLETITTATITTSVTAVTTRRVVQFMPRLTHHSSAQPMITGTMISSCKSGLVAV